MKQIIVPADIDIRDPVTGVSLGGIAFRTYALQAWLADPRFANTPSALRRVRDVVMPAFSNATAGAIVLIEDSEHARLVDIIEAPQLGVANPTLAMQLLPFMDAILDATTYDVPAPPTSS